MKFVGATWWEDPQIWWFPNPSNWHLPKDSHPKCVEFVTPMKQAIKFGHLEGGPTTLVRRLTITMVTHHLRPSWDDWGISAEVVSLRCWFEWFHFSEGLGFTWLGSGPGIRRFGGEGNLVPGQVEVVRCGRCFFLGGVVVRYFSEKRKE